MMQTVPYGEQQPCQRWILPFALHFRRPHRLRVPPIQSQKTTEPHRWGEEGLGGEKVELGPAERVPEWVLEGRLKALHPWGRV